MVLEVHGPLLVLRDIRRRLVESDRSLANCEVANGVLEIRAEKYTKLVIRMRSNETQNETNLDSARSFSRRKAHSASGVCPICWNVIE